MLPLFHSFWAFQAPLDTCLDSHYCLSSSLRDMWFTVYAPFESPTKSRRDGSVNWSAIGGLSRPNVHRVKDSTKSGLCSYRVPGEKWRDNCRGKSWVLSSFFSCSWRNSNSSREISRHFPWPLPCTASGEKFTAALLQALQMQMRFRGADSMIESCTLKHVVQHSLGDTKRVLKAHA